MRLIDADAFKKYIIKGFEEMKSQFKTEFYLDIATRVTESFLEDIDEQPTVEAQPNRCESCIHSEEQDGSNCYECVKGMADNFEAQPTDAVWRSDVVYIIKGSLCDLRRNEDKQIFINTINSLPSVTPQKPKGKWIEHEIRDTCRWLTCSICGYEWIDKKENYCHNCGAEMEDEE